MADYESQSRSQGSGDPLSRYRSGPRLADALQEAGKITIKHGPIANLEMPGMTMEFRVQDPAMLDRVNEGDKVKFVADRVNGSLTVVQMESSP